MKHLPVREEIIDGKKRIIFIREATGIDKRKEAALRVFGEGWIYDEGEDSKTNVVNN